MKEKIIPKAFSKVEDQKSNSQKGRNDQSIPGMPIIFSRHHLCKSPSLAHGMRNWTLIKIQASVFQGA